MDEIAPKPWRSFEQQLELLTERGLIIEDKGQAAEYLSSVNYYRLSGYILSFKTRDLFHRGVTFDHIVAVYEFDRNLRNLLTGLLELIEISTRTGIAYFLGRIDREAHLHGKHFLIEGEHSNFLKNYFRITDEARRGHELFVEHHDAKYGGILPIWAAVEIMSFGVLSRMFRALKNDIKKSLCSEFFGVNWVYMQSWLHALAHLRNVSAHYGRIYDKKFSIQPKISNEPFSRDKVFAYIYVAGVLCPVDDDWNYFVTKLEELIETYEDNIEFDHIGFTNNWVWSSIILVESANS